MDCKRLFISIANLLLVTLLTSCTISYKLNGASIDYTTTKKSKFASQTRLSQVRKDGDLQLSGAITGYSLAPQAVKSDAYAAETRLTIKIKVKFVCKPHPTQNFEKEFSAYRDFEATQLLTEVQDELCNEMIEEIVEQIFNATVANW